MLALIATVALAVGSPGPGTQPAQVLVTLNGGDYQPGDRVRVEIEPEEDGYLIVFRVDGDGYLRVLFPLDPDLDPFVRGGGRYELRGRGEQSSFLADDRGGTGMIFAALSREPLAFDQYAAGSHWDYERLWLPDPAGDAEAQLMTIVRAMSDNGRFDYDAAGYRVWGPGFQAEPTVAIAGGYSEPYYEPYYDRYYDPYYGSGFGCLACSWGTRSGISISIGNRYGGFGNYGYRTNWYDPFRNDYYGVDYGYGSRNWNGWFGWDSWYGTPYRPYTVINVPPRPIVVDSRTGLRSRPRQPSLGGLTSQPRIGTTVGDRSTRTTGQRPVMDTDNGTRARAGSAASTPRSGARPATTSTPRATTSSPSPRTAAPTRSRGRPGGDATGDTPVSRAQPTAAADRPVYRPPTSVSRRPGASPTATPPAGRPASSSRLGGDDVRARTGSSSPKVASPPSSSGRTAQPRTASAPTRSSVAPPRSSSVSPRRSSAPPSRASSPPQSSRAPARPSSPRTSSAPPRTSSAPARSSSPRTSSAPPRTSSAPARSSSPGTSSAPARSSSPRTSSAPARSSSPASSTKSTGSSRPRGNS